MSKLLAMLLVATGLCLLPVLSNAADKEDTPPKAKEKEKAKPKEKESTVEWSEVKTAKGELKKPEYKKGQKAKELPKVEFSTEAPAFRVKWTTKPVEGKRGGAVSMTLYKKEAPRGNSDKETFKRAANLGNARGESEGSSKMITTGKGDYYIELDGDAIEYEITVESAEKKAKEPSEDK